MLLPCLESRIWRAKALYLSLNLDASALSKDISEYHFGRKIGESVQLKAEKTLITFFSPARVQVFLTAHATRP